jgi:hypothetical protein
MGAAAGTPESRLWDSPKRSLARNAAFFAALLATSFALGGALAHAIELANKIGMTREEYFTVQQVYSGCDRLAYVLAAARTRGPTTATRRCCWNWPIGCSRVNSETGASKARNRMNRNTARVRRHSRGRTGAGSLPRRACFLRPMRSGQDGRSLGKR